MSDSTDKFLRAKEKIARLRQTFINQLPERINEGRAIFEQLKQTQTADNIAHLHRFFHSIKGTSRSFGFESLANCILAGDEISTRLLNYPNTLPKDWIAIIDNTLNTLAYEALLLSKDDYSSPQNLSNLSYFNPQEHIDETDTINHDKIVYICDDDVLATEQLATQLGFFGYHCRIFNSTQALRQAISTKEPNAIIMDINFPEGQNAGIDVLDELFKQRLHPIPSIFLSSRQDFAARMRSVQAGGAAYFLKPAKTLDIVAMLDNLTEPKAPDPFRVLIVDDESEIASYHAIILQQAGMVTEQLNKPEDFLEVLQSFRPDLVLMDMYMPCCNGRDLAKMIRQIPEYISLPIVFLSSEMDRQKQFSAMSVGAEGFLTKPVVPEYLVAAVAIRAERMRILRTLMAKDSLTGLFNHTTTTTLLNSAIKNAKRSHKTVCFAMLDIDHFKQVNDTHGHPVGDQVLLAISRVLQQRLRASDVVGRYGGEEFAIILPETKIKEALKIISTLRQDFARIIFHSELGDFSCTFSAGIACFPIHRNIESLRAAADKALYQAKHKGRNCVITEELDIPLLETIQ
jgi:diguanylate cyclase (GGDEF)-like protein